MAGKLIGMSFSSCVRLIADNNFPLDRVAKIICGGKGQSDANWKDRIDWEKNSYQNPTKFREIGETLRSQGKLYFPGESRPGKAPFQGFGCWTTSDEFVIPMDLYGVAFEDFNQLSREGGVYTSKVIESEWNALSNTVVEYNRAAIESIRAKHKPGLRQTIAQFFQGA